MKKYLFYFAHPSQYHVFKNVIARLKADSKVVVLCKEKDILETLMSRSGFEYTNIQPNGRSDSKLGIVWGLLKRETSILRICCKEKPDLMISSSAELAHVGALLRIPSIAVGEDDVDVVKTLAQIALPFASTVLSPVSCKLGKWEYKGRKYEGYQKLAYLHPNRFTPDHAKVQSLFAGRERYFMLRLVKLNAHHDFGIDGFADKTAEQLVRRLEKHGTVWISPERALPQSLAKHQLTIDPTLIHHALAFAHMYIGDSQSMAVEAALLGTPNIRVSDFVGRIGVLEELEHKYKLTIGIKPGEKDRLFATVDKMLAQPDLRERSERRKTALLEEKIDVTAYFEWFFRNYPKSSEIVRKDPGYPCRFK